MLWNLKFCFQKDTLTLNFFRSFRFAFKTTWTSFANFKEGQPCDSFQENRYFKDLWDFIIDRWYFIRISTGITKYKSINQYLIFTLFLAFFDDYDPYVEIQHLVFIFLVYNWFRYQKHHLKLHNNFVNLTWKNSYVILLFEREMVVEMMNLRKSLIFWSEN